MIEDTVQMAGRSVSRETFDRLKAFEDLVRRWSPTINLVSKGTLASLWDRHILDSTQVFWIAPDAEHWVDLGSGGGFPGIVVAILARDDAPAMRVKLVESDLRKATFLRQAAQALDLQVTVLSKRIDDVPPLSADVLSARALAPLTDLMGFASRHLRPDGLAIFPKGARHAQEIADAQKNWTFDAEARQSLSDPDAAILMIRNIHRAQNN